MSESAKVFDEWCKKGKGRAATLAGILELSAQSIHRYRHGAAAPKPKDRKMIEVLTKAPADRWHTPPTPGDQS